MARHILNNVDYGRDLNAKIPGAPDFQYWELVSSYTAVRHTVKNIPTENQWKALEAVAVNILQPIRTKFGPIRVTSGFRNKRLCELVRSSVTSNHARGQAVDIEPINEDVKLIDILEYVHTELEYRELIAEYFPHGWIHIAYRQNQNDKQLKLKDKDHKYSLVSLDYIKKLYK